LLFSGRNASTVPVPGGKNDAKQSAGGSMNA
jgi:hypothetical protein